LEWLGSLAKPPVVKWLSYNEEAAGIAASYVPADASVDPTEAG
jgi:hypothetical protein